MRVFATVGTTEFDGLVQAVLSDDILSLLSSQGYRQLTLQLGRGPEPSIPPAAPLEITWYRFKPSLEEDMRSADLLVSHAGAGSILEGMRLGATMVVVVNDTLMHNHQQELAEELGNRQHLLATTPSALGDTLQKLGGSRPKWLQPLPPVDTAAFPAFLESALGLR